MDREGGVAPVELLEGARVAPGAEDDELGVRQRGEAGRGCRALPGPDGRVGTAIVRSARSTRRPSGSIRANIGQRS